MRTSSYFDEQLVDKLDAKLDDKLNGKQNEKREMLEQILENRYGNNSPTLCWATFVSLCSETWKNMLFRIRPNRQNLGSRNRVRCILFEKNCCSKCFFLKKCVQLFHSLAHSLTHSLFVGVRSMNWVLVTSKIRSVRLSC